MSKISCDVCQDLIPLVKDQVASHDSILLVEEHTKECEYCRECFLDGKVDFSPPIDDQRVINNIHKGLYRISILILFVGGLIGVGLSSGMGMFYNFLIMPFLGAFGCFILSHKWYYVPLGIFSISVIWMFIYNLQDGMLKEGYIVEAFTGAFFFSTIYCILTFLGIIITMLLKYAFRKSK